MANSHEQTRSTSRHAQKIRDLRWACDYPAALREGEVALREDPEDVESRLLLAFLHLDLLNVVDAEKHVLKAMEITAARRRSDDKSIYWLVLRESACLCDAEVRSRLEMLSTSAVRDSVNELENSLSTVSAENQAWYPELSCARKSWSLLDASDPDTIVEHSRKFAEAPESTPKILCAVGDTLWTFAPQAAFELAKKAVEKDPNCLHGYSLGICTLTLLGDPQSALALAERLLELSGERSYAQALLASALNNVGRHAEAIRAADEALKGLPHDALASAERGAARLYVGPHKSGIEDTLESLKINPKDFKLFSNLGALYGASGDAASALKAFDKALETIAISAPFGRGTRADEAALHANRARALCALHRNDDAHADLDTALKLNPDLASARQLREQIQRASGRR